MNEQQQITIVLLCIVIGGIIGFTQAGGANTVSSHNSYVIQQGEFCEPIEPVESGETVSDFYDYYSHALNSGAQPYSTNMPTSFQETDTSTVFLHDGPNGLSLVMVHDLIGSETGGGAATFEVAGAPTGAEWIVEDDDYGGQSDEFQSGDGWVSASWVWGYNRTDGGAIQGGFDDDFAVTINPEFNDDAELADETEGEITSWDAVSGGAGQPDRTTLPSVDDPVTIRTGDCSGPPVRYERLADGLMATVQDAKSTDSVPVSVPRVFDDSPFERLTVTGVSGDFSVGVQQDSRENWPNPPDGTTSVLNIVTDIESVPADYDGTMTFRLEKGYFEDRSPEEIALYEYHEAEERWLESPTTVRDETEDSYLFEANLTSLSAVTVAPQQSLTATDVTVNESSITAGDSVRVDTTVENPHYRDRTYTATLTAFGETVDEKEAVVPSRGTERVTFEQEIEASGTFTLETSREAVDVTVNPAEEQRNTGDTTDTNTGGSDDGTTLFRFGVLLTVGGVLCLFVFLWTKRPLAVLDDIR